MNTISLFLSGMLFQCFIQEIKRKEYSVAIFTLLLAVANFWVGVKIK
jgi:hypothetical protein